MKGRRDPRAYLLTRLPRWGAAEALALLGNLLPRRLAAPLWGWAVRLNPHHETAATNRALALLESGDEDAWDAFATVLDQLANVGDVSASDLYLSRAPGRALRRLAARCVWGASAAVDSAWHDAALQRALERLARGHFRRELAVCNHTRASRALATWRSLAGDVPRVRWSAAGLAWSCGERDEARRRIAELAGEGCFPSPLDAARWADRLLASGEHELADRCLRWARRWLPEMARVWQLAARLAFEEGRIGEALELAERALAFDPQHLDTVLLRHAAERGEAAATHPATAARLEVEAPTELELGGEGEVRCRLRGVEASGWTLYVLPPAGWGLEPGERRPRLEGSEARFTVAARRPDRVRGEPWPLVVMAIGPAGYLVERRPLRVTDPEPGRVLVTVTEDHEIHEERGTLSAELLQRLLVEKSSFAARELGVPWTHMVETGSALAMLDRAAETAAGEDRDAWLTLRDEARRHLAEEVARGHDVQPHLHAFNDPAYPHFAYELSARGWHPSLRFLATAAERRGDWASACPPPGAAGGEKSGDDGLDRLASVERAVAQVEELGRLGDADYRAALWRSGLLEYGADPGERAWSSVALARAGLVAGSDQPKPRSPLAAAQPAHYAGWEELDHPWPDGPLLQLPIAANLEGDYLMGGALLRRRARRSLRALERDGRRRPGVHLFTLLTHDKFLNARRGRDEFRLDPDYGDWHTARRHLDAWRAAGARFVTAREGVETLADDRGWRPLARLGEEIFVAGGGGVVVRYRLVVLGRGIPVCKDFPQHLLVTVPPWLRSKLEAVELERGGERQTVEMRDGGDGFWLRRTDARPIAVWFRLATPQGPELRALEPRMGEETSWRLVVDSPRPFLAGHLLVPWEAGLPRREGSWRARTADGDELVCRGERGGVAIGGLRFDGASELEIALEAVAAPGAEA